MVTEQGMLMNTFGVNSLIPFDKIRLIVVLAYLVAGALIGAVGSVISTRKHIDV
jgi:cell division transport system permease protein